MKTIGLIMFAAALLGQAAVSSAEDDITSSLVPTGDGHGVAACVSVGFDDLRELPRKAARGLWSLIVCVTQPVHPYHYVRDAEGAVVKDGDRRNKKVWFPFYRLWGAHQGDSVVGIVYDNRATNGIAGSCWFAGYDNSGWQDKGGKLAGLALLVWGASEAFDSDHRHQDQGADTQSETVVTISHHHDAEAEHNTVPVTTPPIEPESPEPVEPVWPPEWEGEGGPVGR